MQNRCVILTTHSMEECLALCHRIGIMVQGNLRCLGSAQRLQSRFGNGYELNVNVQQEKVSEVIGHLQKSGYFESVDEIESFENNCKIRLTLFKFEIQSPSNGERGGELQEQGFSLGKVFEIVESAKSRFNLQNYTLSQTTLEQIFIKLARVKEWN